MTNELISELLKPAPRSGDGGDLYLRSATVVSAQASSYTVTLGGNTVAGVVAYRGAEVRVGDVVDVLLVGGVPRIIGVIGNNDPAAPYLFTAGLSGSATTTTAWYTNNAVASFPYPFTMVVDVDIVHGFNGAVNTVTFGLVDEGGANILTKGVAAQAIDTWAITQTPAAVFRATALRGIKNYAAGATAGLRLNYKVDTSNIFADASIKAAFYRT